MITAATHFLLVVRFTGIGVGPGVSVGASVGTCVGWSLVVESPVVERPVVEVLPGALVVDELSVEVSVVDELAVELAVVEVPEVADDVSAGGVGSPEVVDSPVVESVVVVVMLVVLSEVVIVCDPVVGGCMHVELSPPHTLQTSHMILSLL